MFFFLVWISEQTVIISQHSVKRQVLQGRWSMFTARYEPNIQKLIPVNRSM